VVAVGLASADVAEAAPAPKSVGNGVMGAHVMGHVFGHVAPQLVQGAANRAIGRSVGSPTEGHLVGGAHLDDAPYLRVVPAYAAGDVRWGLEGLVAMLDHAARTVRKQFPDAVMSVGHISRAGGGELDRHASHESGRDADVGFYVKNQAGRAIYAEHFVAFKGDGTAPSWPGAHFDDARNWTLVASLVGDGHARVSHIFVATPIRARLLAYAEKIGAPSSLRQRAAEVMAQPRGALPHDDHFHVRIMCPTAMEGCIEIPTSHSDRYAQLTRGRGGAHGRPRGVTVAAVSRAAPLPAAPQHPSLPPRGHRKAESVDTADLPAIPASPPIAAPPPPEGSAPPPSAAPPAAPEDMLDPSDPPPASMTAPIDDVDGPMPFTMP
jgi:penicillin-insensitive murein endopeptidase